MNDRRPSVLVSGSSGMLGQKISSELTQRGYEVYGIDQADALQSATANPHFHHIQCDLTNDKGVQHTTDKIRKLTDAHLSSVVHTAAYYDFSGEDSPLYDKITVNGTDRLLSALENFQLDQFVFTSTMLVHESCEIGQHIRESDALLAKWPYPQSKIDTEHVIRNGHPDVRSVLLRIAGVYTDWGKQPTLVQQIKRIYEKDFQSYFFPGDPQAGQSAVYLDDTIDAIVRTVERRSSIEPQTAILIGEPNPPSYEALQDKIGTLIHGDDWATVYLPPLLAKAGAAVTDTLSGGDAFIKPFMIDMADDHYALDISRAEELLGWRPSHNLLEFLPAIIDKLQSDPNQWYCQNGLERPS